MEAPRHKSAGLESDLQSPDPLIPRNETAVIQALPGAHAVLRADRPEMSADSNGGRLVARFCRANRGENVGYQR